MEDKMKLSFVSGLANNTETTTATVADEDTHYWLYSPGEQADMWEEFYEQGIMAIGWYDLGSLNKYGSKQEIKDRLQELYGTSSKNDALALWEFCNVMEEGDIVFVKRGRSEILGRGVVISDYFFDRQRKEYRNVRKVRWEEKGSWQVDRVLALKTLTDITWY